MKDTLLQQSIEFRPQHRKDLLRYKTAKRTLDALLDYVDGYGETFVGIKTLANRLLVSNQTVMNHFEILKELGVLEIEKIGNKAFKKVQFSSSKDSSSECSSECSKDSSSECSSKGSNGLESKEVTKGSKGTSISKTSVFDDPKFADALEVSNYLLDKILEWKPNLKKYNLETWAKDIDKALRIDDREKDELLNAIDWIYSRDGEFWQPNILSGKKLREQYDVIEAQAIKRSKG